MLPQTFYLPIIAAAGRFGWPGAVATACLSGIVTGPLMPLDVAAGLPQAPEAWVARLVAFLTVGVVVAWLTGESRVSVIDFARDARAARVLLRGLDRGDFSVRYQPVVDLGSGRTTGFEALCRWGGAALGAGYPSVFIPLAERTGTVGPIGRFVLREALRQGAEWRRDGCDVVMAVNVSAHQLSEPDLFSLVHATLRDTGLRPEGLCIEITETAIVRDRPTALGHVRALHDLGVTIALDDFGSGHASLAYLLDFPIDILKIDVAFVSTVDSDARSAALVSGIVQLAGHSAPRRSPRASSGPSSSTRCERWAATTARATSWADPGRRPPARRCARRTTRRRRSAPRGTDGAVDPLDRGGALGRAGRDRGQLRTRPCSASSLAICVPPTRPFSTWRPSGPPGMSSGAPSRRSLVACSRVRMS